ncbi:hypothetical protein P4Q63_003299 [Salmonella enterica]|nr:hypothetical protein [Salmonella enterica]
MKKLIIAAGIAAAVASFGASAVDHTYTGNVSHASINTMITGDAVVTVTGTNGSDLTVEEAKTAGKTLGSFNITLPSNVDGYGISHIHSHGYPDGFKVKFNDCAVTANSEDQMKLAAALPGVDASYECVFAKTVTIVSVTTDSGNDGAVLTPGVKTITADFTAYTE